MVTLTIEQGAEFEKTHFKNKDELLAYLTKEPISLPHENPKFMQEVQRRSKEFHADPSVASPWKETLQRVRRSNK